MSEATQPWSYRSPGDLSVVFPEMKATPVQPVVAAADRAASTWARTPLEERLARLKSAQTAITAEQEELARGISLETGKPLTEARGEMGAVIAKFDLTAEDARVELLQREVGGGAHPAWVRRAARGPAAVVGPFNFPLHLANGALVAHLAAGSPVIFKPSPLAAHVAQRYAELMRAEFPPGVFDVVQGGATEGESVCLDPRVRAVCFTGSVKVGRALARALVDDIAKDVALELGGRNAVIVCADADLALAARAIADGACLTCGQRCNATSRVFVDTKVADRLAELVVSEMQRYTPGDPLVEQTKLGPLISAAAVQRFGELTSEPGEWLLPGKVIAEVDGKEGHYVTPALRRGAGRPDLESFVPVVEFGEFSHLDEAVALNHASPFGLTTSVFTRAEATFWGLADVIRAGNIYANLPTTFSPSTLPFGGLGLSGNGRPGGRGFIRFCTVEQAIQLGKGTFTC